MIQHKNNFHSGEIRPLVPCQYIQIRLFGKILGNSHILIVRLNDRLKLQVIILCSEEKRVDTSSVSVSSAAEGPPCERVQVHWEAVL